MRPVPRDFDRDAERAELAKAQVTSRPAAAAVLVAFAALSSSRCAVANCRRCLLTTGVSLQDHWTQAKLAEFKLTVARQDCELQAASVIRHELEAKCRQLTDTLAALTATEQSSQVPRAPVDADIGGVAIAWHAVHHASLESAHCHFILNRHAIL